MLGPSGGAGQGQPLLVCVLPQSTQHELQSDLLMAATCVGLGRALERPGCKQRLAAASARAGVT